MTVTHIPHLSCPEDILSPSKVDYVLTDNEYKGKLKQERGEAYEALQETLQEAFQEISRLRSLLM